MLSRRQFHVRVLAALGGALLPVSLMAKQAAEKTPDQAAEQTPGELREGQEWRAISPPQPSDELGIIEVLEFFSYGCSHCAHINPLVKDWAARLPADVQFRRVPVTFGRAAWKNLARLYYALELAGVLDKLDQQVFKAVTEERIALYREGPMLDWVEEQDVDRDAFAEIFQGFAVETKVGRAKALSERYEVDGVPMIAVGGRYAVLNSGAKGYEDLLVIADQLIDKARQESAAASLASPN